MGKLELRGNGELPIKSSPFENEMDSKLSGCQTGAAL